jgi:hypothetical protein
VNEKVKGDILWSLPGLVSYRPGTELPFIISAVNLSDEERQFMLRVRTLDRWGRTITEDAIGVDGRAWFVIDALEREEVTGSLRLGETDVTLGVFLVDRETESEVDAVYTYLQGY